MLTGPTNIGSISLRLVDKNLPGLDIEQWIKEDMVPDLRSSSDSSTAKVLLLHHVAFHLVSLTAISHAISSKPARKRRVSARSS